MPKYPFDKCFVITSSDDSPETSTKKTSITDTLSIKCTAYPMMNPDDILDISSYDDIIKAPSSMTRIQMVSLIAHVEVWQKIANHDMDSALILEDTAVTNFDSSSLNTKLLEFYNAYSDNFDILYLGKCQDSCKQYKKAYDGVYRSKSPLCKYAYIITKACAKKLLNNLPSSFPTDVFITKIIESESLKAYVFHPSIIRRNDLDLILGDPSKSKALRESVYQENVECRYETEEEPESSTDIETWMPLLLIVVFIIICVVIFIIISRR